MLKGVAAENKLKIVWICGFSNEHIRSELNLVANPFIVKLRKLFGKADKHFYSDFGAWITALIEEFKKMPDVELHIITGHNGMKRLYQEFSIEGIHYHIFKQDLPFIHYLPKNRYCLGLNPKILAARHFTNKFIQKIKPDIVHLYGAEGIVKSIPALDVKNVPVLVALQTVYSDPQLSAFIKPNKLRLKTEIRVHQRMKYFGTGSPYYRDIVLSRNPKAYIFRFVFPTLRPKTISNARKKYDFVFYATTLSEVKGAPDSIEALAVVKKHKNDVSLNLVGNATNEMMNKLKKLVNSLGLYTQPLIMTYSGSSHVKKWRDMLNTGKSPKSAVRLVAQATTSSSSGYTSMAALPPVTLPVLP